MHCNDRLDHFMRFSAVITDGAFDCSGPPKGGQLNLDETRLVLRNF